MLHQQIKDQIKEAMLAKETVRLNTLRGLLSAFTNDLVAKKRKPQEELSDEEALDVIRRSVKQRKDSIEQFKAGGRNDLVESEEAELVVLQAYLPQMMSQNEIRPLAEAKKTELGITDKVKAGQLMGAIMKDLKGKADSDDVKSVVDSLFA
jgi:uncharacterized protein YqeY